MGKSKLKKKQIFNIICFANIENKRYIFGVVASNITLLFNTI